MIKNYIYLPKSLLFFSFSRINIQKRNLVTITLIFFILNCFGQASDLFISEYIEGSGNNKYLEIYNGTGASVDLSDYELRLYSNGSGTPSDTNTLAGLLPDTGVIVYSNSSATLYTGTTLNLSTINFNGDDAIALYKISTSSFVDIFGVIGDDPGTQWVSGGNGTANRTWVRQSSICGGITTNPSGTGSGAFITLGTEWTAYAQDTVSNLGSHTASCASCTPTHTITSFSPTEGPVNTQITISGSGFTGSSTVTIGGQSATIVSQTSTELSVILPSGTTSGVITITEAGCDTSTASEFTILSSNFTSCDGVVSPSELFISQLTDATSGSLSYIELYNGTGATVDLSDYTLQVRYNAGATVSTIPLSGLLANDDTFVASTTIDTPCSSVTGADGSLSEQTSVISGINAGNNNSDCISLYRNYVSSASPGTLVDVWGDCGDNNWMSSLGIGNEGYNFSRLTSVTAPSTTFSAGDWTIVDWEDDACTDDDYSDIDNYTTGLPPSISSITPTIDSCGGSGSITVVASEGFDGVGDTKDLVYLWYSLVPGDVSWTLLTDTGVYSNTSTNTLNISSTLGLDGYQYYCEVRENDASCYIVSETVSVSVPTASWNGTTWLWNDGTANGTAPNTGTVVYINDDYDTSAQGSFSACSLVINNASILNVNNGNYVEVINDVLVNDGRITTQTRGSFVQQGDNTDAGTFTLGASGNSDVNKTTSPLTNWYDYTYWSSPVEDATTDVALFASDPNRRFYFNAANYLDVVINSTGANGTDGVDDNGDDWALASGSFLMTPGQGFAATHSTIGFISGNSYSYNFDGAYNTGDINYPLVYTSPNALHWNLIGNPYPSAIDADAFFAVNGEDTASGASDILYDVLYMWSHVSPPEGTNPGNEVLNFNQNDYITINAVGEAGNGTTAPPSRKVPSGQAFFVASKASNNVLFTNSMRVSGNNANDEFYRTNTTENTVSNTERLYLNLSSTVGIYSQICVAYADIATDGYDGKSIDTERNYAGNAGVLYSLDNTGNGFYVIQGKAFSSLNEDEVIRIGFGTYISTNETYTIDAIKTEGTFMSSNPIYLKDNLLNTVHDLTESSYTFNSDGGTFEDRFEIVFKNQALSVSDNEFDGNDLTIIEQEDDLVKFQLNSNSVSIETISIYDLQGRLIYNLEGNSNIEVYNLSNLKSQVYIAKIELSNGSTISKKAVKK
ncbi:putative secreted protein (Por secretion system target) [Winogradskyella wandonensis]|uniref:Putative secreted protein (Por secretion system target) n=1 Tax=Winogradskyella wandonensis TaxID=1442586 RepID=A0A4R1KST3_9FLAO|nr:lamin tail domain-containing protein [Winogradskyella wandonensis]TCK67660.1 putative secreted protein (Por secretion system target) [Winogradskyella wandonensis]